jgi:ABC-type hemin transport system substrate-binding protein
VLGVDDVEAEELLVDEVGRLPRLRGPGGAASTAGRRCGALELIELVRGMAVVVRLDDERREALVDCRVDLVLHHTEAVEPAQHEVPVMAQHHRRLFCRDRLSVSLHW